MEVDTVGQRSPGAKGEGRGLETYWSRLQSYGGGRN